MALMQEHTEPGPKPESAHLPNGFASRSAMLNHPGAQDMSDTLDVPIHTEVLIGLESEDTLYNIGMNNEQG